MSSPSPERPGEIFDGGMQHERTALAWERTAIATMVAGVILARYAAASSFRAAAAVGVLQTIVGGALLVWAGNHYEELHGPLRSGTSVVHRNAAKFTGLAAVLFSGFALVLAIALSV